MTEILILSEISQDELLELLLYGKGFTGSWICVLCGEYNKRHRERSFSIGRVSDHVRKSNVRSARTIPAHEALGTIPAEEVPNYPAARFGRAPEFPVVDVTTWMVGYVSKPGRMIDDMRPHRRVWGAKLRWA